MFSHRLTLSTLFAVASTLVFPAFASAPTMEELSFEEMTWIADLVVEATVHSNVVERTEGREFLRTVTHLTIESVIKGDAYEGEQIDVLALGGRRGTEETSIESAPIFTPDERVLVFLEQRKGEWRVVGLSQGKLTLVEERDTARDVIVRVQPPRGLAAFDETQVQLPPVRKYADDLTQRLRTEVLDGAVPAYRLIPGLPAEKDQRFRAEATAAGQTIDPRWAELDSLRWAPSQPALGGQR